MFEKTRLLAKTPILFLGVLALCGCTSFLEDRTQEIKISTNPSGAFCTLIRNDIQVAVVAQTPGTALVRKTADDIVVKCFKSGFRETVFVNDSRSGLATFGNRKIGGRIGREIGSTTWMDYRYQSPMLFNLTPR